MSTPPSPSYRALPNNCLCAVQQSFSVHICCYAVANGNAEAGIASHQRALQGGVRATAVPFTYNYIQGRVESLPGRGISPSCSHCHNRFCPLAVDLACFPFSGCSNISERHNFPAELLTIPRQSELDLVLPPAPQLPPLQLAQHSQLLFWCGIFGSDRREMKRNAVYVFDSLMRILDTRYYPRPSLALLPVSPTPWVFPSIRSTWSNRWGRSHSTSSSLRSARTCVSSWPISTPRLTLEKGVAIKKNRPY